MDLSNGANRAILGDAAFVRILKLSLVRMSFIGVCQN